MISADDFIERAKALGHAFYTGVPCSFLTPLINSVLSRRDLDYVGATSEGEAVAIAAGAWLAGRLTVVMCQNSGLGNAVNPLTSLNAPFRIPTLLVITWRGQPGVSDEPQHEVMGRITQDLLRVLGLPQAAFPISLAEIEPALRRAAAWMVESGLPYALVMKKGDMVDEMLRLPACRTHRPARQTRTFPGGPLASRAAVMERFLALTDERTAVIATTGKCGRELFTLADRVQHIYQVGSMGGASAMALGVALNTKVPVVVLDGDGAALMKLGNLATIGGKRCSATLQVRA